MQALGELLHNGRGDVFAAFQYANVCVCVCVCVCDFQACTDCLSLQKRFELIRHAPMPTSWLEGINGDLAYGQAH